MDGSDIPTGQVRKKAAKNVRDGSSIPQKQIQSKITVNQYQ